MFRRPPKCPNKACRHHISGAADFYVKKGYYKTKHNHQPVPRYKCKTCGVYFSSQAFSVTWRQHKPQVNDPIMKLLCSGVSLRRTAKLTGVCKRTMARKLVWLGGQARTAHQYLGNRKRSFRASGQRRPVTQWVSPNGVRQPPRDGARHFGHIRHFFR